MFPSHPLFGQADTTAQAEPWRPFDRNWLRDDDPKANLGDGWQHGFDSQGRIVLARNQHWGQATVWRLAEQLHRALAGTKHVTDDFAVLAIDDHGDVDSFAVPA